MPFTYRPTDDAKRAIEIIKSNHHYLKTNSKVVNYALESFSGIESKLKKAETKIWKLENGLDSIKDTILDKARYDEKYNKMVSKLRSPE